MKNKTQIGLNRTGMALSPRMGPEMLRAADMFPISPVIEAQTIADYRATYVAHATPIGTMPPPGSLKEAGVMALETLKGHKALVFMDKLGARLAFERTGVRLYEALLPRLAAGPHWQGGPSVSEVERIRKEELRHAQLLHDCIRSFGGDPTVQTPSADISAMASSGVIQVLGDPRVSLRHALDGILIAELVDVESWSVLINLADKLGHEKLVQDFRAAEAAEEQHLALVRSWLQTALFSEADMDFEEQEGVEEEVLEQMRLH